MGSYLEKKNKSRKNEIDVNVSQGKNNRCANFQLKTSKFRVKDVVRIARCSGRS